MDFGSKERVHLNLAIYKKGSERFEIAVEPELAIKFKQGDFGLLCRRRGADEKQQG